MNPFVVFASSTLDIMSPWAIHSASNIQAPNLSELMEAPDGIEKKKLGQ